MSNGRQKLTITDRFRGFLPVAVDVETGGFNAKTDALLEIAAQIIEMDDDGRLVPGELHSAHVVPFRGANIEDRSLEVTGIDPTHPFRGAVDEKDALKSVFQPVREELRRTGCQRAILVGHNPSFDLGFLNAAVQRTGIKRNPFHPFSTFDTVTLGGLAYGQTVLSRVVQAADLDWNSDHAHSAVYDTRQTARLFCDIVNRWDKEIGVPQPVRERMASGHE